MKRVLLLLLCLVIAVCSLASCDALAALTGGGSHTHTYEETLSADAQGHWYDATCDCEDVQIDKIAHTDANNDGICDECAFTNHTHTYETETWANDAEKHWRAPTCGHDVIGIEIAEHDDSDFNGQCDTCLYLISESHTHTYNTEAWDYDESYHWNPSACGHESQITGKAAHNLNAAGYCTVCNAQISAVDKSNFSAVLAAAIARHDYVTGGTIKHNFTNKVSQTESNVSYTLGTNSTFVNRTDSSVQWTSYTQSNTASSAIKYWFELISEEEVFGVVSENNGTIKPTSAELYHLNGYDYTPSTIFPIETATDSLENVIYALYNLTVSHNELDKVYNLVQSYDEQTGTYNFSFGFARVNNVAFTDPDTGVTNYEIETSYFEINVEFVISAGYVITSANIIVDAYSPLTLDLFNGGDQLVKPDYTYDHATGKITMTGDAEPDRYSYVVSQTEGVRTYVTEYPKSALVPSSFDFIIAETQMDYTTNSAGELVIIPGTERPIGGTVEVLQKNGTISVFFRNPYPNGSSFDFLTGGVTITVVDKNDPTNTNLPHVYHQKDHISCGINKLGTFTITLTYGGITQSFDLRVVQNKPLSIGAYVFETKEDNWGSSAYATDAEDLTSEITVAAGEYFDFIGAIDPSVVDQLYSVTVKNANGATVTSSTLTSVSLSGLVIFGEEVATGTVYRFSATTAGTYTITLKASRATSVTHTITVTVE